MNILPKIAPQTTDAQKQKLRDEFMRMEAKIGGELFGPLPKGHSRQFFCFDPYTWIWHETWKNTDGKLQTVTTRYDVRPNGVLKSQNGHAYSQVSFEEAQHLYQAAELYQQRISVAYQTVLATA